MVGYDSDRAFVQNGQEDPMAAFLSCPYLVPIEREKWQNFKDKEKTTEALADIFSFLFFGHFLVEKLPSSNYSFTISLFLSSLESYCIFEH